MYRYVTMQFISLPDERLKSNMKLGIKSSSKSISRLSKDIFKEYLFQQIAFSFRFYFSDTTFSIALHFANVSVNWVEETGNNLMIYFKKNCKDFVHLIFPFSYENILNSVNSWNWYSLGMCVGKIWDISSVHNSF